ncbi:MAG: hypothetical protein DYG85_11975 [Chloroflexi bacterium CFX1]|nr:hypothetical protein [Chloroflexi bacterium CFX1]MCQ3952902.1 hypothetical protein [Chloroflexota bacterium]
MHSYAPVLDYFSNRRAPAKRATAQKNAHLNYTVGMWMWQILISENDSKAKGVRLPPRAGLILFPPGLFLR